MVGPGKVLIAPRARALVMAGWGLLRAKLIRNKRLKSLTVTKRNITLKVIKMPLLKIRILECNFDEWKSKWFKLARN